MKTLYCKHCGRVTSQEYRSRIPTYEEAKEQESDLLNRMGSGHFGLFDVAAAKMLKHEFVADIKAKVDKTWRDLGLDEARDIEGKDMYNCSVCGTVNFAAPGGAGIVVQVDSDPESVAAERPGSYQPKAPPPEQEPEIIEMTDDEAAERLRYCRDIGYEWSNDINTVQERRNAAYQEWQRLMQSGSPGGQAGDVFEKYRCWQENLSFLRKGRH